MTGLLPPLALPQNERSSITSISSSSMIDIRSTIHPMDISGNWATYTSFDMSGLNDADEQRRIDFCFGFKNVSGKEEW